MFSPSLRSFLLAACTVALAGLSTVKAGKAGTMEVVGHSGVSAQMMFLGDDSKVYILDKTENNPINVNGHPAWAVEYDIDTNSYRTMDVRTNTFCAGGAMLGDGRWLVTGGNKAVGKNGDTARPGKGYGAWNGGKALRFLKPCSNQSCQWKDSAAVHLDKERWYPTVEPLKDGHVAILGGMRDGGFVPTSGTNEASYEFYPPKGEGGSRHMPILERTVPLSLYPITYLMSSGELFVQAGRQAILWNYNSQSETRLANIPGAPRVYPASGGSALLPLRPSNNYKETILFCGGMALGKGDNWGDEAGPRVMVTQRPASTSCEQISPFLGGDWESVDDLPEARSMGQFIQLPDGRLWFGNGVKTGTAGYTDNSRSAGEPVGKSFGDNPSYQPYVYDPTASAGNRWKAVGRAKVGRLYHSSATLLPDSSILVAGSNPNPDYTTGEKWSTEYRVERWYPEYYDEPRPSRKGLPSSLSYGGKGFTLTFDSASAASKAKVVVIRTGFSTHGMNMGQRMIELASVAVGKKLVVSQLPPNPNLFAPGSALAFVVVDGVPSRGKFIMVGNGEIGKQPILEETVLPTKRDDQEDETGELLEREVDVQESFQQHKRGGSAYSRINKSVRDRL
ncbi:Glyoxaloxidase 2 [Violaceomyces palustris]|uniref:Glyoxaloxidase 2 n=1 Tax=Violaceomyces palustris TaxID=1673888 RepID=A0ACD0NN75_9BASI|nr:Glyoxaloxidase 2 [Violaceomyces palustris]